MELIPHEDAQIYCTSQWFNLVSVSFSASRVSLILKFYVTPPKILSSANSATQLSNYVVWEWYFKLNTFFLYLIMQDQNVLLAYYRERLSWFSVILVCSLSKWQVKSVTLASVAYKVGKQIWKSGNNNPTRNEYQIAELTEGCTSTLWNLLEKKKTEKANNKQIRRWICLIA